jgi:hypothetical protein
MTGKRVGNRRKVPSRLYPLWVFSRLWGPTVKWVFIEPGDSTPSVEKGTDFGVIDDFSKPKCTLFLLDNQGNSDVTLTAHPPVEIVGGAGFSANDGLPHVIAAHKSASFEICCRPTATGEITARVGISYSAAGVAGRYMFTVRGAGLLCAIELLGNGFPIHHGESTPSAHKNTDFGNVPLQETRRLKLEIDNRGQGTLRVTNLPVGGTHAAEFGVGMTPSWSILAGKKSTLEIKFTPRQVGLRVATVTIESNDPGTPSFLFAVQGTGQPRRNG